MHKSVVAGYRINMHKLTILSEEGINKMIPSFSKNNKILWNKFSQGGARSVTKNCKIY